jgi:hypothetical protein
MCVQYKKNMARTHTQHTIRKNKKTKTQKVEVATIWA